jgi:hypothetical protein
MMIFSNRHGRLTLAFKVKLNGPFHVGHKIVQRVPLAETPGKFRAFAPAAALPVIVYQDKAFH